MVTPLQNHTKPQENTPKRTGIDPIETGVDTGSFRTKSELKAGPKHSGLWQTLSGSGAQPLV